MVDSRAFEIHSKKHLDVINITETVSREIVKSAVKNGIVLIFVPGSTGAITNLEFEPGLVFDIREFLESLVPYNKDYRHHSTWGDDNGSGHLLSALLKTSFTVPVVNGKMVLGTWQQIIFIECDTRPRSRKIIIQVVGD